MSSRWFHNNCSAFTAEQRLVNEGVDGSFLVRPSSKPGDFTISVRYKGVVNHIKIANDGDSYCLSGSPDPFATLQSLIQNYMDNPNSIKEKNGGYIELLYPVRSYDPTNERWYHGRLGSKEAERILLAKGQVGSYLVRESHSNPGQYVLVVKCKDVVRHIIIKQTNGVFEIAGAPFLKMRSLRQLIDHLVKNPSSLHDVKDQTPIIVGQPYHSTSFIASSINERFEVLQKSNENGITGFHEEFEQLIRFDQNDGVYTMNDASLVENKGKNRYKNILPYDHSRVKLTIDPERGDYINANYIDAELQGSVGARYIASQGPMENTNEDFWNMVFQENSSIILMLTNERERNEVKCAKYWPDYGEEFKLPKLIVENLLETETTNFIRRELQLSSCEEGNRKPPMIVYQYHYTEWHDHGVPDDPGSIIDLLNEIHSKQIRSENHPPMIVHCSAGIGRTGTVMAIDILMHLIDELGIDNEIDIQRTCQILRTQRSGMVQTERQYQLIYRAIATYIESRGKGKDEKVNVKQRGAGATNYLTVEKPMAKPADGDSLRPNPPEQSGSGSPRLRRQIDTPEQVGNGSPRLRRQTYSPEPPGSGSPGGIRRQTGDAIKMKKHRKPNKNNLL